MKMTNRKKTPSIGRPPYGFLIPAFLIYTLLLIIPLVLAIVFSFTDWNGFITTPMNFVGLKNYLQLFKDARMASAVKVTLRIAIVVVVADNVLGLLLAMLLNKPGKLTTLARTLIFAPYVMSAVAVSYVWMSILSYTGILNTLLTSVGLDSWVRDYLGTTESAIWCISIVQIWQSLGFHMVIYLASLKTVPSDLYEACTIDGGNSWHKFRYITLPMITQGVTISVLMGIINYLKIYDIIKILTAGGPGTSTQSITYYAIERAFSNNKLGYGSAMSVVLFVFIAIVAVFWFRASTKKESD